MAAKPKKPILPAEADALIADSAWASLSGMGEDVIAAASGDFAALVAKTRDAAATVDLVRSAQPHLLEAYADDLLGVVNRTLNLNTEDAALMVMGLLSSTTLARILADVANGNIEPVAATAKKRKPRTLAPPPAPEPATVEVPVLEQLAQSPEAQAEAAAPKTTRKRKVTKPAEATVPAAAEPTAPAAEPDEGAVEPGDFDDFSPVATPEPAPATADETPAVSQAPDPAAVQTPAAPFAVGSYTGPVGYDDF